MRASSQTAGAGGGVGGAVVSGWEGSMAWMVAVRIRLAGCGGGVVWVLRRAGVPGGVSSAG